MDTNFEDAQRLGLILSSARLNKNRSQDYMAMCLGVSKNTVSNWERGTSVPNLRQFVKWCKELSCSPFPYLMRYVYPSMSHGSTDSKALLHDVIDSIPEQSAEQLLYCLAGEHGSSAVPIINMLDAHLHCDMRTRVNVARIIYDSYEMCGLRGELICQDEARPDMDMLKASIEAGKAAAMNGDSGYVFH